LSLTLPPELQSAADPLAITSLTVLLSLTAGVADGVPGLFVSDVRQAPRPVTLLISASNEGQVRAIHRLFNAYSHSRSHQSSAPHSAFSAIGLS
jgi:hypothetical protein